jgi:hypothetical protein
MFDKLKAALKMVLPRRQTVDLNEMGLEEMYQRTEEKTIKQALISVIENIDENIFDFSITEIKSIEIVIFSGAPGAGRGGERTRIVVPYNEKFF